MSCEHHKKALIRGAASAAPAPVDLREHIEVCISCRDLLEREQLLLASIDGGLRRMTTADVPPSLLPRIRASLVEDPGLHDERFPSWLVVAASMVLVVGIIVIQKLPYTSEKHSERAGVTNGVPLSEVIGSKAEPQTVPIERGITGRNGPAILPANTRATKPRAFVPIGQRAAISRLVDALRQGEINGEVLLAKAHESPAQDLLISPIEISPIAINPLDEQSQEDP